jgi:hypothetical protein
VEDQSPSAHVRQGVPGPIILGWAQPAGDNYYVRPIQGLPEHLMDSPAVVPDHRAVRYLNPDPLQLLHEIQTIGIG